MENLDIKLKSLREEIYRLEENIIIAENNGRESDAWELGGRVNILKEEARQIRNKRTALRRELSCGDSSK